MFGFIKVKEVKVSSVALDTEPLSANATKLNSFFLSLIFGEFFSVTARVTVISSKRVFRTTENLGT